MFRNTWTWSGKFQSTTFPFIYGKLETELRSPIDHGYTTKVQVTFEGPISFIANFFSQYMEPQIYVSKGNRFTTKIGEADVVFKIITDLKENTTFIEGEYTSTVLGSGYVSTGTFSLLKK